MTMQGGSVSYAAVTAKALGLRTCAVVTAGPDADLSVFDGVDLHVIRAEKTLTFEHRCSERHSERSQHWFLFIKLLLT
jgi:hypothetical protein